MVAVCCEEDWQTCQEVVVVRSNCEQVIKINSGTQREEGKGHGTDHDDKEQVVESDNGLGSTKNDERHDKSKYCGTYRSAEAAISNVKCVG